MRLDDTVPRSPPGRQIGAGPSWSEQMRPSWEKSSSRLARWSTSSASAKPRATRGRVMSSASPSLVTTWMPGSRRRVLPSHVVTKASATLAHSKLKGLKRLFSSSVSTKEAAAWTESRRSAPKQRAPRDGSDGSTLPFRRLVIAASKPWSFTPSQVPPATSSRPAQIPCSSAQRCGAREARARDSSRFAATINGYRSLAWRSIRMKHILGATHLQEASVDASPRADDPIRAACDALWRTVSIFERITVACSVRRRGVRPRAEGTWLTSDS